MNCGDTGEIVEKLPCTGKFSLSQFLSSLIVLSVNNSCTVVFNGCFFFGKITEYFPTAFTHISLQGHRVAVSGITSCFLWLYNQLQFSHLVEPEIRCFWHH